ncbi:MAG: hypothetical protein JW861_02220 [Bacteroidales bacterium]|nr:hypothetical protein [Bacteroidales bacterium]
MKTLIILNMIIILAAMLGCTRYDEKLAVEYSISKSYSDVNVQFRDGDGVLRDTIIHLQSIEDQWQYHFEARRGDIVYVSAIYFDSSSTVTAGILLEGKLFKQGSSNKEPGKYVTVSGTVPY